MTQPCLTSADVGPCGWSGLRKTADYGGENPQHAKQSFQLWALDHHCFLMGDWSTKGDNQQQSWGSTTLPCLVRTWKVAGWLCGLGPVWSGLPGLASLESQMPRDHSFRVMLSNLYFLEWNVYFGASFWSVDPMCPISVGAKISDLGNRRYLLNLVDFHCEPAGFRIPQVWLIPISFFVGLYIIILSPLRLWNWVELPKSGLVPSDFRTWSLIPLSRWLSSPSF